MRYCHLDRRIFYWNEKCRQLLFEIVFYNDTSIVGLTIVRDIRNYYEIIPLLFWTLEKNSILTLQQKALFINKKIVVWYVNTHTVFVIIIIEAHN